MNKELFELSLQSFRRKKRSSLLLFAVLFLSFAFAIVSLTVTGSIQKTNQEYRYDVYGEWYGALDEQFGDESFLRRQEWLVELGTSQGYGTILTSKVAGSGTGIGVVDDGFLEVGRISLKEGRFPKAANEIVMEADLLGHDYTLGQEVTFKVSLPVTEVVRKKYAVDRADDSEDSNASDNPPGEIPATVTAEVTFTLCGVLQEYTSLWMPFDSDTPLNGAFITEEGVETLRQAGKEAGEKLKERENARSLAQHFNYEVEKVVLNSPTARCFFSVQPGMEEMARRQTHNYLMSTARSTDRGFTVNTATLSDSEESVTGFYAWLILGVTVLAVVCIYVIRMQDEARQLAIFRSIGITKRQLCIMLLYETLLLGAPAMLFGTGAGALGTWTLLKLTMYSESVSVYVVVPPMLLAAMATLWILGVLGARLAVFLVALRAPLTGRFYVARKKARRYTNLRRVLIAALSVLLCTALLFTAVGSVQPVKMLQYLDSTYDFVVSKSDKIGWQNDGDVLPTGYRYNVAYNLSYLYKNGLMPTEHKDALVEIPGVEKVYGWGQEYVRLDFDGIWNARLLQTSMAEYRQMDAWIRPVSYQFVRYPPGIGPYDLKSKFVFLMMVDEDDWEDYIDFSTIDREKFRAGEQVLLSFYLNENGKFPTDYNTEDSFHYQFANPDAVEEEEEEHITEFEESDLGIAVGDTISVTAGSEENGSGTVEAEVGGIIVHPYGSLTGEVDQLESQYTIICSGAFLEKLMDSMGKNTSWHIYRENRPYGYRHMFLYLDSSADYLSTDASVAEYCAREQLHLNADVRSWKQAIAQQYTQKLILILTGGICVALVVLLILWNALSMEVERQKRNVGIQQALGMSKRQLNRRQFGIAALRGGLGVLLGWLAYGGYWALPLLLNLQEDLSDGGTVTNQWLMRLQTGFETRLSLTNWNWTNWPMILLLTALCIGLVLGVSWLANRRMTKEDLMAKLRDEH